MMKSFYFLLVLTLFSLPVFAQTEGASLLYGYRQPVMPGNIRVDDNGRELPRKRMYNYFIYLASGSSVSPVEIWIDGEAYRVIVSKVDKTPVEYAHPNGSDAPRILVPKTKRRVLQLAPSAERITNPSSKGKEKSKSSELVLIYRSGARTYFKTLTKFTELDRLAMQ